MPDVTPSPIADLRRAVEVLEASSDPGAKRTAARLRLYDERRGEVTLDRAAGLVPPPGRLPWWEQEALARRDAAIRTIRERHFRDLGVTQAAREIAVIGKRYATSDGRTSRVPDGCKPLLAAAVSASAGGFPGERRILDILRS